MPNYALRAKRWSNITLLEVVDNIVWIQGPNGPYDGGDRGPKIMKFQCDCGHRFEMPEDVFPGVRRLRSCGRPECSFKPVEKLPRQPKQPMSAITARIPSVLWAQVLAYAHARHIRASRALTVLLRYGFASEPVVHFMETFGPRVPKAAADAATEPGSPAPAIPDAERASRPESAEGA